MTPSVVCITWHNQSVNINKWQFLMYSLVFVHQMMLSILNLVLKLWNDKVNLNQGWLWKQPSRCFLPVRLFPLTSEESETPGLARNRSVNVLPCTTLSSRIKPVPWHKALGAADWMTTSEEPFIFIYPQSPCSTQPVAASFL